MTNEEKLKEFFKDEEKVKQLTHDEEFMGKVSEGEATPETYVDAFKKFGIELSIDEAKALQGTVADIMAKPVEELDETVLKDVSGGERLSTGQKVAAGVGFGVAGTIVASELAGLGCLIASRVYLAKATRADNHGKSGKAWKYAEKAERCGKLGVGFVTLGIEPAFEHYENS